MLIIREAKFAVKDGQIYLLGSASNDLFRNNLYQMGAVSILGWQVSNAGLDFSKLQPLEENDNLRVTLYPDGLPLIKKAKVIENVVKNADCLSLKFGLMDALIACHYARKYRVPYVIESASETWEALWYHGGSPKYKLLAFPMEWLIRRYHRKAKYILYVSQFYLQKKYPSKAVQAGCSDAVLHPVEESVLQRRIRKIEALPADRTLTLGLIGAARVAYRGHDTLIRVMAKLRRAGYDVRVRFLGDDKGKESHIAVAEREGVAEYVSFDGYRTQEGVFEWIDGIDILVMPTLSETLGRAVIEAMSRGCPVIGSAETALPEQIGSDCIAPARDVSKISEIVEHMILDNDYMKWCAYENYYRAKKYDSAVTNERRRRFYQTFYRDNGIPANYPQKG